MSLQSGFFFLSSAQRVAPDLPYLPVLPPQFPCSCSEDGWLAVPACGRGHVAPSCCAQFSWGSFTSLLLSVSPANGTETSG